MTELTAVEVAAEVTRMTAALTATATSTITAQDEDGIPGPVLTRWLARLPRDAVVLLEADEPQTLRATWTEAGA